MFSNSCPEPSSLNFAKIPNDILHTRILGGARVQCEILTQMLKIPRNGGHLRRKNHTFALFTKSILVTPMKLGRDIARGNRYLVYKFDLKRS